MVYEVPLSRIDEMADVSAEAFVFQNDPIGNFMFQNEPDHLNLKRRFFRSLVTSCSPKAVRQAVSPELEAVSIWFPPGMDHSEDVEVDPFKPEDFTDPGTLHRLQSVNEVIASLTESLGAEPQWYLHLVAVRPSCVNQGHASRLIRAMLEKVESDGLPCTLITQRMENVRIYEHWGFRPVKEMSVACSRETFYSMRK